VLRQALLLLPSTAPPSELGKRVYPVSVSLTKGRCQEHLERVACTSKEIHR